MRVVDRFERLQRLFDAALEFPADERSAFAAAACADDPSLQHELLGLLDHAERADLLDDALTMTALDHTLRRALPKSYMEGQQLGPFTVLAPLGDGGMGRVYRATRNDGTVEQEVAIKLVRSDRFNPALLKRFSLERRLLAALDHPRICRFIDTGALDDGSPYVVMELVRGQPLFHYCDLQQLDIDARLRLLREILSAVDFAHRSLIVHRDIKSDNILVTADGEPKLLDFGIAKSLAQEAGRMTATAERFLTPSNAAPEQLRGDPVGVGCDVYALGLLAYELLVGRAPFDLDGLTAGEIERLLVHVPPPPMSQRARAVGGEAAHARRLPTPKALAGRLSGDLDAIVSRCLRKAAAERYPSVAALDSDLRCVLEQRPISARSHDRLYRIRKFVGRHRLAVALSATLVVTLLTSTATVGWLALDLAQQRNAVVLERDRAQEAFTLLSDAFVAADPARVDGAEVTAAQILAAARPRIEVLFDRQPLLYAALAASIADVQLGLSLHADAHELAERGLQALRLALPDPALEHRLLLLDARALLSLTRYDECEAALASARALDTTETAEYLVPHGMLLSRQRREHEAVAVLARAVQLTEGRSADAEIASVARWELARTLADLGEHVDALRVLDRAIAWQQRSLSENHPRLSLTRLQRVDLLRRAGQVDDAQAEARRTLERVIEAYGERSAMSARALLALAMAAAAAGDYAQAQMRYEQTVDVSREVWGDAHPRTVVALFNLAALLDQQSDRHAQAAGRYRDAVTGAELAFGPGANRTVFMRLAYARFEARRGNWRNALALLTSERAVQALLHADDENREGHLQLVEQGLASSACTGVQAAGADCSVAKALLSSPPPAAP